MTPHEQRARALVDLIRENESLSEKGHAAAASLIVASFAAVERETRAEERELIALRNLVEVARHVANQLYFYPPTDKERAEYAESLRAAIKECEQP